MKYTDDQLLNRVAALPTFKGFPKEGVLDIWVRSKADPVDKFDDKVYSFDCDKLDANKLPTFKMVCTGTSHAGSFGLLNFHVYNPMGCAVLCADTIVYYSHAPGFHKGKPAYRQIRGFPHTRDSDRDLKAENYGKIYNDVIGANCHRAGWFSTVIYNWSVACLVRNQLTQFLAWLKFMNRRKLSVAILNEF